MAAFSSSLTTALASPRGRGRGEGERETEGKREEDMASRHIHYIQEVNMQRKLHKTEKSVGVRNKLFI